MYSCKQQCELTELWVCALGCMSFVWLHNRLPILKWYNWCPCPHPETRSVGGHCSRVCHWWLATAVDFWFSGKVHCYKTDLNQPSALCIAWDSKVQLLQVHLLDGVKYTCIRIMVARSWGYLYKLGMSWSENSGILAELAQDALRQCNATLTFIPQLRIFCPMCYRAKICPIACICVGDKNNCLAATLVRGRRDTSKSHHAQPSPPIFVTVCIEASAFWFPSLQIYCWWSLTDSVTWQAIQAKSCVTLSSYTPQSACTGFMDFSPDDAIKRMPSATIKILLLNQDH